MCGLFDSSPDTNMEWEKSWCELKGSWGELGVLFWIVLALIGYATKDNLNISPSVIYYELHTGWLGLGLVTLVQIFSITDGSSAEKVSSSEEVVTNKRVSDKEASDNGVSEYTKEVLTESNADVLPLIVSDTDADECFDPDERVDADRLFGIAADPNGVVIRVWRPRTTNMMSWHYPRGMVTWHLMWHALLAW